MKRLAALALVCLISTGVFARAPTHYLRPPAPQPEESQLIEHGQYINRSGRSVHSPAHTKDDKKPQGATAKCRDGTWSFSQSHRGTCSHHGGVANWEQ
ncbi:DUF3761 domain-containing protein [Ramlibacter ginsenosidimutans]|uniref:DUF3761 domain-containing protein n=2 Tax=Ramlibacter ginsenosidimutans TaxID=502333 RepID=A0A934WQ05_9BURK|nr:DUF3761 domain-containing protein [Ramlibacter ginsenosidimutans]MBK6008687.1 DUF3761 domain-containing protein [Ramlibacter ginsenosidimutans]